MQNISPCQIITLTLLLGMLVCYPLGAQPTQSKQAGLPGVKQKMFSLFLIGDAGDSVDNNQNLVLSLLRKELQKAGDKSALAFLGDNVCPKGLPLEGHPLRKRAERVLTKQLETVKQYEGSVIFIPGNHDWEKGNNDGWAYVQHQEKFIEDYLGRGNVFLPDGGCPGPVEISLSDQITLVIVDTQWWLHPWDKPEEDSPCEVKDASQMLVQLEDILHRNAHKKIIVAGHHPMYSYGLHRGYSPAKLHLFPLTEINKSLYIPLPVIGSVYPFYRNILGSLQDIPHPRYKVLRNALVEIFSKHPDLIYAGGHEHSLQYISKRDIHYVVSGAG